MTPVERLVEYFGGQTKTAKALGVSQPAVHHWLSGAHALSARKAFLAEQLTEGKIQAWELCPQIPRKGVAAKAEEAGERRAAHDLSERRGRRETDPTGAELKTLRDCAEQALAVAGRLVG